MRFQGQTIADVPYICLWYANYMPNICQICGHNVQKVCLEGMVDIIKLSPLPIQLSHMFVTLALVKRGRVGVPNSRISYFGPFLHFLNGLSNKQICPLMSGCVLGTLGLYKITTSLQAKHNSIESVK